MDLMVNGEMHLYGDVGDPWGDGSGFTPTDVVNALAMHGSGDITVRINSGGGIADNGMAIFSLLKSHPGKVTTMVDGIAASAASLIAMAGDTRTIRAGALLMIHDPATIAIGNPDELQRVSAILDKIADNYAGVYARAAGKPQDAARAIMKREAWYTAPEAVADGFATAIAADKPVAMAAFDYSIYMHAPAALPSRKRQPRKSVAQAVTAQVASAIDHAAAASARMRMLANA